jgi:hypothetical protein
MKTLNEEQAWAVVANTFGYRAGLCNTINQLSVNRLISLAVADRMRKTLNRSAARKAARAAGHAYFWPVTHTDPDAARMAFARKAAFAARRTVA